MTYFLYIGLSIVVLALALWAIVTIYIPQWKAKARREKEEYQKRADEALVLYKAQIDDATAKVQKVFADQHYIAAHEWEKFVEKYKPLYDAIALLKAEKELRIDPVQFETFWNAYSQTFAPSFRKEHNEQAKTLCKQRCAEYFDTLFAYPLDDQQRDSIVTIEDNTLVVSAAGSGKTSTIIGKTHYLVDQLEVNPNKILLISYTRKAAGELRDRLDYEGITCSTFHRLALDIIAEETGIMPTIAKPDLLQQVFYDLLEDKTFKSAVAQYLLLFRNASKEEHEFKTPAEMYADRRKYGIQAPFEDMDGHIIYTKSEQELTICTVLSILGVKYRYEEPYEVEVNDREHQRYKPDFSIYYKDKDGYKHRIYWEHFAIDQDGNVPRWFGQDDSEYHDYDKWRRANVIYRTEMAWKRKLHEKNETTLVETTSAEFYAGDPRVIIRQKLQDAGVPLTPLDMGALYEQMVSRDKYLEKNVLDLIESFINLMKANGGSIEKILANYPSTRTHFILSQIISPVYKEYSRRLEAANEIDFTDAILQATQICHEHPQRHYEYILVDEFQDISIDRYRFLLALRSGEEQSRLFCVGDDWQSIYRFSGSDMSLFSQYEDFFGATERCNIESTHRFGQPLVKESSVFIKKNPIQVQKNVQPMPEVETKLTFHHYNGEIENAQYELVRLLLSEIPAGEKIYLLGRYTYDAEILNVADNVTYDDRRGSITVLIDGREIPFLTVHSSKGLEADHVILLNCNEGKFPSDISDDPVLSYVLSKADDYPDAEERRVFYVGITRAKKHTYVVYDSLQPSPFVTEFVGVVATGKQICPKCRNGYLFVVKDGQAKTGKRYKCIKCTNVRAGCDYFKTIFEDKDRDFDLYTKK
ncbi:MAG: UvrD-helicase domain-containing protein [Paludibacteraceae bacterium]|nr:UvrD-helicase domain-containing protein [Paludibacteraceae bacterium]